VLSKIRRIKQSLKKSVNKKNEFDPEVYNDEQYENRDFNVYHQYGG